MNENESELSLKVDYEMEKIHILFVERLPEDFAEISNAAARLAEEELEAEWSPAQREWLAKVSRCLHGLAGAGGTFGYDQLTTKARELEWRLDDWLAKSPLNLTLEMRRQFFLDSNKLPFSLISRGAERALLESKTGMALDGVARPVVELDGGEDRPKRIWLVNSDPAQHEETAQMLGQFGYEIQLMAGVDELLGAWESARPDAVLMGMNLIGGLNREPELTSSLRALDCPLLFSSSHDDFRQQLLAARSGGRAFLREPLDVSHLVDHLDQIFDQRRVLPYRILIIDDDVILSEHYRCVLSSAGMEVSVLTDPCGVMERVAAFRPEIVLLDMYMPGCSGPEIAAIIRFYDEWIGLPIIYLSAETDLNKQVQAMGRGGDDFFTKPISNQQLVSAVVARATRFRQLADLMTKDSLTGLLKHGNIKESLTSELTRASRSNGSLSVAMVDIDHFKAVNDRFGHAMGDRVIKAIAQLLRQRLRKSDTIGRYGGEEFVVLMPNCDAASSWKIMDDIRLRFSSLSFQCGEELFSSTFSAGVACTLDFPKTTSNDLLQTADKALYAAKHGGRNRVCLALEEA